MNVCICLLKVSHMEFGVHQIGEDKGTGSWGGNTCSHTKFHLLPYNFYSSQIHNGVLFLPIFNGPFLNFLCVRPGYQPGWWLGAQHSKHGLPVNTVVDPTGQHLDLPINNRSVKCIFMASTLTSIFLSPFTKAMFEKITYNLQIVLPHEKISLILILYHSDTYQAFDTTNAGPILETLFYFYFISSTEPFSEGPFFSVIAQCVSYMHIHPLLLATKYFKFSNTCQYLLSSHSVFLPWFISSTS